MNPIPDGRVPELASRPQRCAGGGALRVPQISFLFLLAAMLGTSAAQAPDQNPRPSSGMGVSTGAAHPAVKDAKSRPITAGGFIDGAPVVFEDITRKSGLEIFH